MVWMIGDWIPMGFY